MKILFVAPWTPNEQRPRSLRFLEILSSRHEVRVIAVAEPGSRDDSKLPAESVEFIDEARILPILRAGFGAVFGRPLQEGYASSPALRSAVLASVREWRPDVVHLNVFRTVHLVKDVRAAEPGLPLVVDLDEFRSSYYAQLAAGAASLLWRCVGRIESKRMRARELALLDLDVEVLVSGPREVPEGTIAHVTVVRSICDARTASKSTATPKSPRILFVGRLSYEANVEGLEWFLRTSWERVREELPDAVLDVVGADPPAHLRRRNTPGLVVHGAVDSVGPYYAKADVAIVPIFRGTGVQMKLLQALASGVPTVSTSDTVSRAELSPGEQVLAADAPAEWAESIVGLVRNRERRTQLAEAGRLWISRTHDRAIVADRLLSVYDCLDSRPPKTDGVKSEEDSS